MREFLNGLELEKETVDTIMAEHGKLVTKDKEMIGSLNQRISDLTSELESSKNNSKVELEQFKNDSQKNIENLTNNLNSERKLFAIEKELFKVKAKDNRDVINNLDLSKIEFNDNVLSGLDEQLKEIKEKKSYLFEEVKTPGATGLPHGNEKGKDLTDENKMRIAMGLSPLK